MYRKLDSDLQSSKKRHAQLAEQCEALKKGREDSVSYIIPTLLDPNSPCFCRNQNDWLSYIWILHFHQDEREVALADLKAIEQKHNELKVGLWIVCW